MPQPVLFVIDDDPGVVHALRDDLDRRFGEDFRVIGESSAASGLATLRELADEHASVALLIVDHDMSEMSGVDFLARAHELHPLAKRVLLVERDYSVRSPVVQAMTLGQADYHITKPWMLEQDLYRQISEFLAEWATDQEGGFDLFHVIGRLQDRSTHELRALLTRFNVPYHFHAADSEQGRRLLEIKGLDTSRLPLVIRHDDYTRVEPTPAQIIASVGGSIDNDLAEADIVIVGAGPAGLARRVCGIRRSPDAGAGRSCFRRASGKQPDDPKLSGLSARHQWTRAHASGVRATQWPSAHSRSARPCPTWGPLLARRPDGSRIEWRRRVRCQDRPLRSSRWSRARPQPRGAEGVGCRSRLKNGKRGSMSGQRTSLKRRASMGIVPSGSIAALALVLVAAACGSSSSPASPKRAPSTTAVRTTAPSTSPKPAARTTGSIKLESEPGVTPVELQRAESLIERTMAGLKRFQTPAQAYAAGYRSIGDAVTGDEHYVNWSYANDGHILDPSRPESVVYEVKNGNQTAVAAMYALPFGSSFANVPDVGGPLTQWHVHRDLCLTSTGTQRFVVGITTQTGTCAPGTSKLGDTPMLHVWTIPNPCGPFAALEGIGAGQVPVGQTRNCDTRNASVP